MLLGHTKLESTVRYLGIDVDDALEMAEQKDKYTYRVTWSEEDQEYVGLCAEFPSLSWLDSTPEKVLKGIRAVVTRGC